MNNRWKSLLRQKMLVWMLVVAVLAPALLTAAGTNEVSVEVRMLQMPRETASDLFKPEPTLGRISVIKGEILARIRALEAEKKIIVLCQPKLTTVSGNTAQVKSVQEIRYPTEYTPATATSSSSTNAPGKTGIPEGVVLVPGGFETREVGTLLNVTPIIGPDGKTINLTLVPELSQLVESGGKIEVITPAGRVIVEQPQFRSQQITTTVQMESGTTILLGVSDPIEREDNNQVTLILLTAMVGETP